MLLAPARGQPPRQIAERLRDELGGMLGASADRIEVAGPGFVNVFLTDRWHRESLAALLDAGDAFGRGTAERPERVLVEFVSANPTGPLTAAQGRHAGYGDSLARLLELRRPPGRAGVLAERRRRPGAPLRGVHRRPDAGRGAARRGLPGRIRRRARLASCPRRSRPGRSRRPRPRGIEAMRERIEATLDRFGVRFDSWFSERSLYAGGSSSGDRALRERGHVYESEGAIWLRTTAFGDDKDRVLIRSDGEPTYFGADIAYHRNKLERGADRLVDPLGADHHGYVARMRAAIEALGADPDRFEAPLIQFVHLVEGGGRAQMSKRRGDFVTLDELVDDIGADAARFLMLQRSHETAVDLDLELARRQSQDNPVYYVQYAHARIASILRKAVAEGRAPAADGDDGPAEAPLADAARAEEALRAPAEPAERALVRRLLEFPAEAAGAAERRAPHRLVAYSTATAADFHAFYRDCQVVGAPDGLEQARLAICVAAKRVVARTLDLLGVSAPDRM